MSSCHIYKIIKEKIWFLTITMCQGAGKQVAKEKEVWFNLLGKYAGKEQSE
jgi:hypothetical protein